MTLIQPPKKTDIKGAFEKLKVGQTTFILFRDSSTNNLHKASRTFESNNKGTKFNVSSKDQVDRTLITRLN